MPTTSGWRARSARAALVCCVSWMLALPLGARAQDAPTDDASEAPAPSEPAPSEPASGEPAPSEPASSEPAPGEPAEVAAPAPAARPAPYSVPFYLRPLPAVNVVRLDTVLAPHDRVGDSGLALDVVQLVTVGVRATDWLMLIARMGWDYTSDPGEPGLSNLVLGANFAIRLDTALRLSLFAAVSLPLGTDINGQSVHRNARFARLAMDNAMFLVDHLAGIAGVGFGWVEHGWTVQAEATLLTFGRVEGATDDAIVNSTFGLLVGYFIVPEFSVAGELHHQHFVSDPVAVVANPELRSQTSGTLGVRFHLQPATGVWIRPGLSWSAGFDPPLAADAWQMIQIDVPVFF